ncbi:hypothetical protein A3A50_00225 [Candidatus Woesebacteria bacterium RIFCSPLOWO2_01_FULL_38_20]|nr:MAG: hypothetical protein A3A50_00225 [Candidatus Woesebacteria bacterium RIFCSPLOWO2_01_FULL_38_20]
MENKIFTLTIGIPAHNEENNIGRLLDSILRQKKTNYKLIKIVVICDGCKDNTAKIVKYYSKKYKFIELINDGKRMGKPKRMNSLYANNKSDIFMSVDADIVLEGQNILEDMVECFSDKKVALVGSNDKPISPNAFLGPMVVNWIKYWQYTFRSINNWVNPFNCTGRLIAMRNDFVNKLSVPISFAADDHFIFFKCQELGYKFKYCPSAIVYFKVPGNLSDFINQSVRFGKSGNKIRSYLGSWTDKYYHLSKKRKYLSYFKWLFYHPIKFPFALGLQFIVRLYSLFRKFDTPTGVWITAK